MIYDLIFYAKVERHCPKKCEGWEFPLPTHKFIAKMLQDHFISDLDYRSNAVSEIGWTFLKDCGTLMT